MKFSLKEILEKLQKLFNELKLTVVSRREFKLLLVFIVGTLLLTVPMIDYRSTYSFKPGEISPVTVIAPRDITLSDESLLKKSVLKRMRELKEVYILSPEANEEMRRSLDELLVLIDLLRINKSSGSGQLRKNFPGYKVNFLDFLSDSDLNYLVNMSEESWNVFKYKIQKLLDIALTYKWYIEDVYTDRRDEVLRKRLNGALKEFGDPYEREIALKIISHILEPNVKLDERLLNQRISQLEKEGPKFYVEKGKPIVRKGEKVTELQAKILKGIGYTGSLTLEIVRKTLLGGSLAFLILLFSLGREKPYIKPEKVALLSYGIVSLEMVISKLLENISHLLAPIAFVSILLTLLVGTLEGVIITVLAGVYHLFVIRGISLEEVVFLVFLGAISSVFASYITRRIDFLKVLVFIAVAAGLMLIALSVDANLSLNFRELSLKLLWANSGLLLSLVLAMGTLPFLENYLGFASPIRILELMNPMHPLLQRLSNEAPGTYSHSLAVANLAEQAAKAIGADGLLCRVGAYYHDIGKIKRPEFFIENQFGGRNPHDNLNPRISAIYIISHVRDGVDLAREYKLPQPVIDFIRTHHGTSLVYYFYHKAKSIGMDVTEAEFRYPGPKPFTKETAILMLADTIEAAARTLSNYDINTLKDLIEDTVRMKIEDGQLQNAPLTLAELEKVKEAFLKSLISVYHRRIRYPNQRVT